ncbi:unnamed protein product [Colias eurytheme]|nr:unnamed protein product [Colias eurytheme]
MFPVRSRLQAVGLNSLKQTMYRVHRHRVRPLLVVQKIAECTQTNKVDGTESTLTTVMPGVHYTHRERCPEDPWTQSTTNELAKRCVSFSLCSISRVALLGFIGSMKIDVKGIIQNIVTLCVEYE